MKWFILILVAVSLYGTSVREILGDDRLTKLVMEGKTKEEIVEIARQEYPKMLESESMKRQSEKEYVALGGIVVNLLSEGFRRKIKVSLTASVASKENAKVVRMSMPIVRDIAITTIASKTIEEVTTRKGKDRLKNEIVEQVNARLGGEYVLFLYLEEFLIAPVLTAEEIINQLEEYGVR
ncbi:MAG: flagellar basal body-associated FliL family protein [Campylobacterales bacterium]|nr:flagellar basal body-associated FliL family protein [Campylobacterales bacterium]